MPCEKCGSQLLYGKGDDVHTLWCPNCEGFDVLKKEESIEKITGNVKENGQKIKNLINIFEVESLLTTLFVTREGHLLPILNNQGFNSFEYISLTNLISNILIKGSRGSTKCDCFDNNFQKLIRLTTINHEILRINLLTKQDFGFLIRVPWVKIKDIAVEFELSTLLHGLKIDQIPTSGFAELFKFNENWVEIMDNLNDSGFISPIDAHNNRRKKIEFDDVIEEHLQAVKVKTAFELVMKDKKIFKQDKFKKKLDYVEFMSQLSAFFRYNLEIINQNPPEFYCTISKTEKYILESVVKANDFDIDIAYNLFVTKIGDKTNFPLIYQFRNNDLLIPPLTLVVFQKFLKAIHSKEFKDKLSQEGYKFEEKVCKVLENLGLNVNQPNNCTKKLINIKDDYETPTLEIDIIAYDYHTKKLFVIDCKNIFFTTDFMIGKRETAIREKFKEQPAKQKKRIEFIENNLQKFGLSSRKINKYISVIITTNKEPISIFDNTHIISLREINSIKDLEPIV